MKFHDHIEAYIFGNLSDEDRAKFEQAILTDKDLAQAVKDFKTLKMVAESLIEEDTRSVLSAIDDKKEAKIVSMRNIEQPVEVSNTYNWKKWAAAAAVGLVVGYIGIMNISQSNLEHEIFAQNAPLLISSSKKGGEIKDPIDSMKYYYAVNDFKNSDRLQRLLEQRELKNEDNLLLDEYRIFTAYNLKKFREVIALYDQFTAEQKNQKMHELAFRSYLLIGQIEMAKQIYQSTSINTIEELAKYLEEE